jgi:hypothetical protein
MPGSARPAEQCTAWHVVNTQRVMRQVALTKVDLIGY